MAARLRSNASLLVAGVSAVVDTNSVLGAVAARGAAVRSASAFCWALICAGVGPGRGATVSGVVVVAAPVRECRLAFTVLLAASALDWGRSKSF